MPEVTLTDAEKTISRTATVVEREDGILKVYIEDQYVYLTLTDDGKFRVEAISETDGEIQIDNRNHQQFRNVNLTFPAQ